MIVTLATYPDEDGGFCSFVNELPGCLSQGETEDEAIRNIAEALQGCLESYRDSGVPVPWRHEQPESVNTP